MNGQLKQGDLVQIIWQDTCIEHDYISMKVALDQTIALMSTVGNFLNQDDESIRIAFTRSLNHDIVDSVATIPLSCVQQINPLKVCEKG